MAFDVDLGVVGDVEADLDDGAAGELELRLALGADGVAAVVADAEPLPPQGAMRDARVRFSSSATACSST